MPSLELDLNGYTDIPNNKIAVVVTHLEMIKKPSSRLAGDRNDVVLKRWQRPDASAYKSLFREIGEDWIWFGRLVEPDAALEALLCEPTRENYLPMRGQKPIGTLELNFQDPANVELSYFGLVPSAIGGGVGRWLMAQAVEIAWSRPETKRLWLHTCTADSPQAMRFYQSCGFRPFKRSIEVADDPRTLGIYTADTAPHVPCLGFERA
ncbi:acetyltransferase (GNAT) family protein [Roseibium hamelinense]|uniref:Acetyltransferase (GNAT) family protein n=1 Tax=Roseibium hamelinense TaxID=150831 RepID=A0A562SYP4_9HYPH|nr:GNAT family N-acetyltransferase [Roseibium hamelinense]MTI43580.1 GNAT family N-acetyltransferase [Roseibium hamelinense]TWI86094.1 acetyltransferase (GNAT) family protein [Roseibium hamelinense]